METQQALFHRALAEDWEPAAFTVTVGAQAAKKLACGRRAQDRDNSRVCLNLTRTAGGVVAGYEPAAPRPQQALRPPSTAGRDRRRAAEAELWRRTIDAGAGMLRRPLRHRRRFDWVTFTVPVAAAAGAILSLTTLATEPTLSGPLAPIASVRISVVDGDTIKIGGRSTRLVGFNAPETWKPQCGAERQLGERATARLRGLVRTSALEFVEVRCACPPGTEGTSRCNYGRACGMLRADGRDVGNILMGEGLAVPFVCRGTGCPPTPRPWCAS